LIPSACTTVLAAVAEGESNDEFIDVDRGDLRILGTGSAFGLWDLPGNLPNLPHPREVNSETRTGVKHSHQRRKLSPIESITAEVAQLAVGWVAAAVGWMVVAAGWIVAAAVGWIVAVAAGEAADRPDPA
jgi:hypothetical protein